MIMSQERRKLASGREVLAVQGQFQRISSSRCQQKCLFQILTDRKKSNINYKQNSLSLISFFSKEL